MERKTKSRHHTESEHGVKLSRIWNNCCEHIHSRRAAVHSERQGRISTIKVPRLGEDGAALVLELPVDSNSVIINTNKE